MANVVIFPFDTFGNEGTGAGAMLLGDMLREAIDDTAEEDRETRSHSFADTLTILEHTFADIESLQDWRQTGQETARSLLNADTPLLWLAGSHLGVLPIYEELNGDDLVIQFDAHLDIYDFHDVTDTLSPGNFLLHTDTDLPRIINLGHRDLFLTKDDIDEVYEAHYPSEMIATHFDKVLEAISAAADDAKRIWIDIDVDVFDPAFLPAVHHAQPFGLTPMQFLPLLNAVWSPKVAGVSLSEFEPGRDVRDQSLNLLGWLCERLLLMWSEK